MITGAFQQRGWLCAVADIFHKGHLLPPGLWRVRAAEWGGELAHTCITEEGTPVHPAAWTSKVDPANPGVKADQRTGLKSSAAPSALLAFLYQKRGEKKLHLLIFGPHLIARQEGQGVWNRGGQQKIFLEACNV